MPTAFFSSDVVLPTGTPIWVPASLLVLVLLMFVWGLTRGNVKDENLPDLEQVDLAHNGDHDEDTH